MQDLYAYLQNREAAESSSALKDEDFEAGVYSLSESSGNEIWANEEELWDEYYSSTDK